MQADDPTSDGMTWYAGATALAPERPRLTFDLDVDICVIGGGLAGLTVAREIARRGWSVAIVEAQTVASGASGRNLGFVLPGYLECISRIVERIGPDHARELWELSERGVEYVRETIRETGMPGVEPAGGWLQVSKFREDPQLNADATLLRDKFGAQVEMWETDRVREQLKSPFYQNAIHFPRAFHMNPLAYTRGLAAAAEQAGVRIFEHTPALSLDPSGIRKRIGTPSARVRAAQIVLAGNTGLEPLMPRLAASLLPVTSYVAVTAPLGDKLKEAVTYTGGVSDTDFIDSHYRIVDGDRLMWNGGMTMWHADPKRYARRLAGDIRRAYPQLGRVEIDCVWSGTVGSPVHRMPQIGEVARGVWVSGGYGGQGFNTSAMAGELIARGIIEGDQTWRLFAPYDLVWAGGKTGRAAMQAVYWSRRVRERLDAQFSRPAEPQQDPASPVDSAPLAMAAKAAVTPVAEDPAGAGAAETPVVPAGEPAAAASAAVMPDAPKKKPARRRKPAKAKAKKQDDQSAAPAEEPAPANGVVAES